MADEKKWEGAQDIPAAEPETAAAPGAAEPLPPPEDGEMQMPARKRKLPRSKKRIAAIAAALCAAAAVLAAVVWGGMRFFGGGSGTGEVLTAVVDVGSITSTVSGEGLARAKESASLTVTASGTVQDVYVREGDTVEAGQPLYKIHSDAAEEAYTAAQKELDSCSKEKEKLMEARANLTVSAPHAGKISLAADAPAIQVGDTVSSGTAIATVVDDSKMKLRQYFSYAYAKTIKTGQSAQVSIPSFMASIPATVSEIHMVERISPEGTKLFEVDFVINNPGTLAAGVDASATLTVGGETLYPYEAGKLEYNRATVITTKVGGAARSVNLRNYAPVAAGDVLLVMDGGENDTAIFEMDNRIKTAQKNLDEAKKALDLLNGISPITGKVMSISASPGDEIATGSTVAVVANTDTILLDILVDERNISYITEGMSVDIDQWGTQRQGEVTSVSLTSKTENGVAKFPVVVSIDNSDGALMAGSYASYNLVASQSTDCMVLPIQAVKSVETAEGTRSVVFVRADTRPENAIDLEIPVEGVPEKGYYPVIVQTGISDTQNVEILSGVEVGTEVFQQVLYPEMY